MRQSTLEEHQPTELHVCPECGRDDFSSELGMKMHYGKTHSGSLSFKEYDCEFCGDTFRRRESRATSSKLYCSVECSNKDSSKYLSGEDHPDWIPEVELECEYCGGTYTRRPEAADGSRFCDNECMTSWQSEEFSGEDGPHWKEPVEIECAVCGSIDEVKPHRANSEQDYHCSDECLREARSRRASGSSNPNWSGGLAKVSCDWCGDAFEKVQAAVRDRNFCSQDCWGGFCAENRVGADNPSYNSEVVSCSNCGDDIEVNQYRLENYSRQYCGVDCWKDSTLHVLSGPDHPAWKDVSYRVYNTILRTFGERSWEDIAGAVRSEADYKCQMCGGESESHSLDVHHIVPLLCGGSHFDENLAALCKSCHNRAEHYLDDKLDLPTITDQVID